MAVQSATQEPQKRQVVAVLTDGEAQCTLTELFAASWHAAI